MTDLFRGKLESTESEISSNEENSEELNSSGSSISGSGSESESETSSGSEEDSGSDSSEEKHIQFVDSKLSILGANLETIPQKVRNEYSTKAQQLDLSHNSLKDLDGLESFSKLKSLVVDNNMLASPINLPKLDHLETLWVNKNQLKDLDQLLHSIKKSFPKLTYLSLFGNPCCPNFFIGKDHDDYKRYRLYVLYKLPKLNFLDSSPVQLKEKQEAKRVGKFMTVKKPKIVNPIVIPEDDQEIDVNTIIRKNSKKQSARFGYAKSLYVGKRSEGNRFIKDNQL
ncbi:leucine-rich melanocyte differentiation-associated protein [Anaeramoeba flamelloides]|uniref:Leucine-rich melanocyte differentiation-associated protein n=1 Tax=Anaeramoeba flamelloides TaxID=1746091 RepID=A0ABQ8XXC0_9EUKA|nr:leucine-rich melanocyte differentiation-associated protein [Anaeramoeba flamelloides]